MIFYYCLSFHILFLYIFLILSHRKGFDNMSSYITSLEHNDTLKASIIIPYCDYDQRLYSLLAQLKTQINFQT
jgi:hypothetical protein